MTTPSQTETARPLDGAMENILDDGQRPGWWRHFVGHEDTECVIRPMHLASLLDRAAKTHGNRLAIRFQNFQMTYSRLHEAAERFAEALRLRGVKPGQRVAVMLPNIPQTVIAFWGIMKAGAVAVMINPLYMEKELLHHFNDAGAEVLVGQAGAPARPSAPAPCRSHDHRGRSGLPAQLAVPHQGPPSGPGAAGALRAGSAALERFHQGPRPLQRAYRRGSR